MADVMMVQCDLQRRSSRGGTSCMTTWLPKRFAVHGKPLELLNNGRWENGWKVTQVHSLICHTEKELLDLAIQYRNTRAASDI
jgi:hypothetical protein